jgi:erythromycin esterase
MDASDNGRREVGGNTHSDTGHDGADGGADVGEIDGDDGGAKEIAAGVYPVASPRFDNPTGNLAALKSIVGDADLVSLGETIHFSDGYARARARVIKYLVAELGFRAVAFEGDWALSRKTNAYLVDGEGDVQTALEGLGFTVWQNVPTEKLLEWLRRWNQKHPEQKVRIFGFDIQNSPRYGTFIKDVASTMNSKMLSKLASDIDACPGASFPNRRAAYRDAEEGPYLSHDEPFPKTRFERCKRAVAALKRWRTNHANTLTNQLGTRRAIYFRTAIRALKATNLEVYYSIRQRKRGYEGRDRGMADVFDLLRPMYAKHERVAIFAHNSHNRRRGTELDGLGTYKSFGSHLAERYGDDYRPIGFFAYEVHWNWPGRSSGSWRAVRRDSIESLLHEFDEKALIVDLHKATGQGKTLEPGRDYYMGHADAVRGVPVHHYDAFFYLKRSEARP